MVFGVVCCCCTNVSKRTAIDDYVTTICPDCNVVVVVAYTIDCALAVDCKLTTSNNVEYAIANCVVSYCNCFTIEIEYNLLVGALKYDDRRKKV